MTGEQSNSRDGLSTRGAVLVTLGIVAILGAAACAIGFWPEIEGRYLIWQLNHHSEKEDYADPFRRGEMVKRLIELKILRTGLEKERVERILGVDLDKELATDDGGKTFVASVQFSPVGGVALRFRGKYLIGVVYGEDGE